MDKIGHLFSTIIGLAMIVFSKKISFIATEKADFFLHSKINEKMYQIVFILVGLGFVITGIMVLVK